MEEECFYALLEYFTAKLSFHPDKSPIVIPYKVPIEVFRFYSLNIVSRYIGETNRNAERVGLTDFYFREISNHKYKYKSCFLHEFNFEYQNNRSLSEHKVLLKKSEKEDLNPSSKAMLVKLEMYEMTFTHLDNLIGQRNHPDTAELLKTPQKKMTLRDFRLKLTEENFTELHAMLIDEGYIDSRTNINEFIRAHSGLSVENKFTWLKDQHSLYLFIRNLIRNGCFDKKPGHGIWDIVAELYKPHDETSYYPEKLKHSSGTKGKSYNDIASIVESISETDNDR